MQIISPQNFEEKFPPSCDFNVGNWKYLFNCDSWNFVWNSFLLPFWSRIWLSVIFLPCSEISQWWCLVRDLISFIMVSTHWALLIWKLMPFNSGKFSSLFIWWFSPLHFSFLSFYECLLIKCLTPCIVLLILFYFFPISCIFLFVWILEYILNLSSNPLLSFIMNEYLCKLRKWQIL